MVRSVQPTDRMDPPLSPEMVVRPSCQRPDHPTGHNWFRQIFRDHWEPWCYQRMENEVTADQRAYVSKIVMRLMLCRDPEGGYARYICPGCQFARPGRSGPGSTAFRSLARPDFAPPAEK